MTAAVLGVQPARSRQEVVELIGVIEQSDQALARIENARNDALIEAERRADEQCEPIKAARAVAQAKVSAWFRIHPEQAIGIEGAEKFLGDPLEAQLTAALLASARPVTERQKSILEGLKEGLVLRRVGKCKSYGLLPPNSSTQVARKWVASNHVFDLQARFLDAYDPKTGERVLGVSAFDPRCVEFRIKPDVVLP